MDFNLLAALYRNYFEYNRDSIQKNSLFTFKVNVPTLKEPEMFYIKMRNNFVVPDSVKYPFTGKIYILQDRFIYSASSNLASLAKNSEQLINIGETTLVFVNIESKRPTVGPAEFMQKLEPFFKNE
mgnify:CR=1 FL=1